MGMEAMLPYLVHLFDACMKRSFHPECYKHSFTVMLPKEGKDDYALPKSWRPVALLSGLGKVLERLVADQLKEVAISRGLIPKRQYGFAGRSTTKALQYLTNLVINGWCAEVPGTKEWKTSLLGLDISGAYDHVKHLELIKVLIDKDVPAWIIHYVWSFLCNRSTSVVFPGYVSPKFWLEVGIPQGSPLSPILFAFFAAPILEQFEKVTGDKLVFAFSYVDDTYIVVSSTTWKENCRLIAEWHQVVMDWATPRGIRFDPGKYNLMHFRKPYNRDPPSLEVPEGIPGLGPNCVVPETVEPGKPTRRETSLRILGVQVDHRMKWEAHISKVSIVAQSR